MRSVRVAVLLAVSSLPQVVLAQIDQTSTAARFRAANLLLSEVIQALARFQYPELDTSDFSQKVAPYQNFLENLKNDVRREGKLNDSKLAALSFFCSTGLNNIENLIMIYPNALLVPKAPTDTPAKLKKIHALAFEYFEQQTHLVRLMAPLAGCTSLDPIL